MDGTLAQILLFAGSFAPNGWAFCTGQIMQIQQNEALFSLLGTMYGGDGMKTFALPDLRYKDDQGNQVTGHEIGKPSYIICTMGIYPTRSDY